MDNGQGIHRPRHLFVLKRVLIAVNGNQFKRDLHEYHYSTSCPDFDMPNWFFVSVEWSVSVVTLPADMPLVTVAVLFIDIHLFRLTSGTRERERHIGVSFEFTK